MRLIVRQPSTHAMYLAIVQMHMLPEHDSALRRLQGVAEQ